MWAAALLVLSTSALAAPRIAVADLANGTGDEAWDSVGPGLSGLLMSRLDRNGLRVVSRHTLRDAVAEQRLGTVGLADRKGAARAGRFVGARYLIVGEVSSVALPEIAVGLRLLDTESGEVADQLDVRSDIGDDGGAFTSVIDELTTGVMAMMELEIEVAEPSSVEPKTFEIARRYSDRLMGANLDHPMSLQRDTNNDFSRDKYERTHWYVYDSFGESVEMPYLARRIGDDEMNRLYSDKLLHIAKRHRRKNWSTLGTFVGGLSLVIAGAATRPNPEQQSAPEFVGISMVAATPFMLLGNVIGYNIRLGEQRWPGLHYTAEEADHWIREYNLRL